MLQRNGLVCNEVVSDFFSEFVETNNLISFLCDILNSEKLVRNIADKSYMHSNGFDKIVLVDNFNDGCKLRLHVWWPYSDAGGYLSQESDIHNHRWDFMSKVMLGTLHVKEFVVSSSGVNMSEYRYVSPGTKNNIELSYIGKARVKMVAASKLKVPALYLQKNNTLHQVVADRKKMVATLVVQGPVLKNYTNVYKSATSDSSCCNFNVIRMTELDLFFKLTKLIQYLQNNR